MTLLLTGMTCEMPRNLNAHKARLFVAYNLNKHKAHLFVAYPVVYPVMRSMLSLFGMAFMDMRVVMEQVEIVAVALLADIVVEGAKLRLSASIKSGLSLSACSPRYR